MKRILFVVFLSLGCLSAVAQSRFWVAASASNWNNTANWSAVSGGAGGASVPTAGNLAVFNGVVGTGACQLDVAPTVTGITVSGYAGAIDLKGFILTTTGANTFASGSFTNTGASASITLSAAGLTIFSGTTFGTGVDVTGSSGNIQFNGSTFAGVVNVTKTNSTNDSGSGNNTFNGSVTLTNSTASTFLLGNTNKDIFNQPLTINIGSTGSISLASGNGTATQFNDNIVINYNSTGNVLFGNGNGPSTLAAGKTLTIGAVGAGGTGNLTLNHFTASATAQTITLSGNNTATLTIGPSSVFGGTLAATAPSFQLTSSTYSGSASITKTGSGLDNVTGGNTWAAATFTNNGAGELNLANTNPDTFGGNVILTNTGTSRIQLGVSALGCIINGSLTVNHGGTTAGINTIISRNAGGSVTINGNVFLNCTNTDVSSGVILSNGGLVTVNGNITVTSTNGRGVLIGANSGTVNMASGFTLSDGGAGTYTTGVLSIMGFTQSGPTAQALNLTGASNLILGPANQFNGSVTFVAPQVQLNGTTYNGTTYIEKNGATDNAGDGGNTFNGTTTLVDSGSGYLGTANVNPDTFTGNLTLTNTGSNLIRVADNVAGTAFNGNITVNSTSGNGIVFSNNAAGTSTFATGKTFTIGGSGFSSGTLYIKRFTQNGTTPINLTLTGTAMLRPGAGTTFGGNVTFVAPQVQLDGATFNGTAYIEKNGPTINTGNGGNTFASTTTLVSSGANSFVNGGTNPDTFNGDLTLTNTGAATLRLAETSIGNNFNGNITINCTSGSGIAFGNVTGTSNFASGKTITVGASGFSVGTLGLYHFTQAGSTAISLTLTGVAILRSGPGSSWGGNISFIAPQIYLDGATYNGTAYIEKTGPTDNLGAGGNTFVGVATLVNSGSGLLLTANISPDTFSSDVTITNSGSNLVHLGASVAGTAFNGNIVVNSTSGNGVYFSNNASGTSTLADLKTISIGGSGFISGELRLSHFTQVGVSTPQTLTLGGATVIRIGPASTFNSSVTFKAPQMYLDGCAYNGITYLEKTGATQNTGNGSNTFATTTTIVNSGSNNFRTNGSNTFNGATLLSNSGSGELLLEVVTGGTYNGDVTMTNTGTNKIRSAFSGATLFNGNIIVNSTGGLGVAFCEVGAAASATLATGKTITTGGTGFTTGLLLLQRFTQLGGGAQTLTLTSSASLQIGPTSVFNGNVDFKAPQVFLNGCTYNGTTSIEKTGATNNDSNGNNIFAGVTTLKNSGSGWLRTARTALDQFNNDLTLTNTGTSFVYMSDLIGPSVYSGNITVNSTLGGGVSFGASGGTSTLANGKTITVGASGFSFGELRLQAFTQTGATAQTLALTSLADLRLGPLSTFNGNVDFRAPQLFLDGTTFNGTAYLEKNGATNNLGAGNNVFASTTSIVNTNSGALRTNGGNTFGGTTTIINSGTNDTALEFTTAFSSTYNGDVTMTNTGSSFIRAASAGTTQFNGNIIVNSTNATGVYFGDNGGISTLANGLTMSVGATGFSAGELRILKFTQTGATAQTLTLTGSALFTSGAGTTWNGNLTVTTPSIQLNGSTFNGTTNSFTKNGSSADNSTGGNTFAGATTFTNTNSGTFRLSNTTGDAFNGDATFVQSNGTIQPAYAGASTASGNITVNSNTAFNFGSGAGSLTFTGSALESINKTGSSSPIFAKIVMGKSGGSLTLNTDISIVTSVTFTTGVIFSTSANFINFTAGSSASGATNSSFVDGPVRKTGNTAFTFPTGNAGIFRSIGISAPAAATNVLTAQYFKAAQAFGGASTYNSPLLTVSSCEYWTLDRTTGAPSVAVTLSWNSADCTGAYITDMTKLRVGQWNGTKWTNQGSASTLGTAATGTITSPVIAAFIANNPFTLASISLANPLPVELISFTAEPTGGNVRLNWVTASELNSDHFTVQKSADAEKFTTVTDVKAAGTTSRETDYSFVDEHAGTGRIYYRLKQVDIDGASTFSPVVTVDLLDDSKLEGYPNPVRRGGLITFNRTGDFQVLNMLGVTMLNAIGTDVVDTSSLPAGLYIVRRGGEIVRVVVE